MKPDQTVLSYVGNNPRDTKNRKSNTPAPGKGCTESGRESIFRYRSVAGTLYTGWPRKTVHLHNSPRLHILVWTKNLHSRIDIRIFDLYIAWRTEKTVLLSFF